MPMRRWAKQDGTGRLLRGAAVARGESNSQLRWGDCTSCFTLDVSLLDRFLEILVTTTSLKFLLNWNVRRILLPSVSI